MADGGRGGLTFHEALSLRARRTGNVTKPKCGLINRLGGLQIVKKKSAIISESIHRIKVTWPGIPAIASAGIGLLK